MDYLLLVQIANNVEDNSKLLVYLFRLTHFNQLYILYGITFNAFSCVVIKG